MPRILESIAGRRRAGPEALLAGRRLAKGESGLRATASTISPRGVALNGCCDLAPSGSTGRERVKQTQGVITSLEQSEC